MESNNLNLSVGDDRDSYNDYFLLHRDKGTNPRASYRVRKGLDLLGDKRGKSLSVGVVDLTEARLLKNAGFENTICDISSLGVKYAVENGFDAFECDIVNDTPRGEYDFIFCFEILEHVSNPLKALNNLKSVLNPGGILIVSLPNEFHFFRRLGILFGIKSLMFGGHDWHHLRFFNIYYAKRLFENAKLDIVNINYSPAVPLSNKWILKLGEMLNFVSPNLFAMSIITSLKLRDAATKK